MAFFIIKFYTRSETCYGETEYRREYVREELAPRKLGKILVFSTKEAAEEILAVKSLEIKHRHAYGFTVVNLEDHLMMAK